MRSLKILRIPNKRIQSITLIKTQSKKILPTDLLSNHCYGSLLLCREKQLNMYINKKPLQCKKKYTEENRSETEIKFNLEAKERLYSEKKILIFLRELKEDNVKPLG